MKKSYLYNGNRLASVEDAIPVASFTDAEDFQNKASLATEYGYDPNGNITIDANSGYTIAYNHLNKPTQILELATNNVINMIYSTDGTKLRQTTYTNGQAAQVMDYSTGYIYKQRELQYFAHEEGRCLRTSTTTPDAATPNVHLFRYEYNLTDHLGNVRISFSDTDNDGKAEVLQEQHYEAYGLRLGGLVFQDGEENRFTYSGKERIGELGLGWSDFGARMYNPAIGRWNGVDALAEKYGNMTPYMYVAGNTIRLTDIDGRDIVDGKGNPITYSKGEDGTVTWSENADAETQRFGNQLLKTDKGTEIMAAMNTSSEHFRITTSDVREKGFGKYHLGKIEGKDVHVLEVYTYEIGAYVNAARTAKHLGANYNTGKDGWTSFKQAELMDYIIKNADINEIIDMIAAAIVGHEYEHSKKENKDLRGKMVEVDGHKDLPAEEQNSEDTETQILNETVTTLRGSLLEELKEQRKRENEKSKKKAIQFTPPKKH